jgi:hypothetical protein
MVQFILDGKPVGEPVDLYSPKSAPKEISLGTIALKAAPFPLSLRNTGRNPSSSGGIVGIDAFILKPLQ